MVRTKMCICFLIHALEEKEQMESPMNIVDVLKYVQKLSNFDVDLTLHNL